MRRSVGRRGRAAVVIALAGTLVSACASTPVDEVRISVKRIALSLAFENEDLAQPVAPEQIIRIIPAPPELVASGDLEPYRTPDRPVDLKLEPEPPTCPAAAEGTAVSEPVGITIDEPPKAGWYRRFNKGKLSIAGGPIPLTLPFPRNTLVEIRDVHEVERPNVDRRAGDVFTDEAPAAKDLATQTRGTTTSTRFTVSHQIATVTVTDVYEYDASGFRLVQRTTKTDAASSVFTPTPQIVLTELGNYGNDWSEGGSDRETNTAMVVRGAITKQEPVDVCGVLVDSLRFENEEQMVNLGTQELSGTSEVPNAYNIAPQRNGLMVREEKHFSQVVDFDGLKLVINWDYVSTLGNLEPYATREDALKSLVR